MTFHIKQVLLFTCLGYCLSFAPVQANADSNWEFSLSGYGGQNIVENSGVDFHHLTLVQNLELDGEFEDVLFTNSQTFGGKITAWWDPRNNTLPQVGFEIEGFTYSSDIPSQSLFARAEGGGFLWTITGYPLFSPIEMTAQTLTLNVVARYPIGVTSAFPHGQWYPYFSVGGGIQRTKADFLGASQTDLSPAFQGTVGVNVFLAKHVSLFAEYKRTQANADFVFPDQLFPGSTTSFDIPFNVNHFVMGLTIHL